MVCVSGPQTASKRNRSPVCLPAIWESVSGDVAASQQSSPSAPPAGRTRTVTNTDCSSIVAARTPRAFARCF